MNILRESPECTKSELDLFLMPPTNTSIIQGQFEELSPAINGSTIEFNYVGTEDYLDLSKCYLELTANVYRTSNKDGKLENTDTVGPVNNFLHSLFSQVEVQLNNKVIENSNSTYAYKSYICDLLNYNQDAKESFLQSALFVKDRAGYMNVIDNPIKTESGNPLRTSSVETNHGFWQRKQMINGGTVQMNGRLNCDIFNSHRYLLNMINLRLILTRSSPTFCLMYGGSNTYNVEITKAKLILRKVNISPSVMNAHNLALRKSFACYPIKKSTVSTFTISTSALTWEESIYSGVLPSRVVIGMVLNKAYVGDSLENPFNFQHFNLKSINLKCNGALSPYKEALNFNIDNNEYISGFRTLHLGIDKSELGNNISRTDYKNGYTLFAYDFTPDLCSSEHFNIQRTGNLNLAIGFEKKLPEAVTLIAYFEFDHVIYIDSNRQVVGE